MRGDIRSKYEYDTNGTVLANFEVPARSYLPQKSITDAIREEWAGARIRWSFILIGPEWTALQQELVEKAKADTFKLPNAEFAALWSSWMEKK